MPKYRVTITALLSLAGVLAVGMLRPPSRESGVCPEQFWIDKFLLEPRHDIVLAGDSRIYRGFSPTVMQRTLQDKRIANFGFSGNGYHPLYLDHVERLLVPDSNSAVIVLGMTPTSFIPRAVKNNDFLELTRSHPLSVSLRHYTAPLSYFLRPFDIAELRKHCSGSPGGYFQRFDQDGWVASRKIPEDPAEALPRYEKALRGETLDPSIVDDVIAKVREWTDKGITVYGFRPPASARMVELENRLIGYEDEVIAARFEAAGGKWLEFAIEKYHSYDGSHLREDGAIRLSRDLAHVIDEQQSRQPTLVSFPSE